MATNNFKPFATAANANVTAQADWETLPALLSGFMAGKASSAQVNKAIRQASFIAAALAQYTANKSGLDVLDDGDLDGFVSKMGTAFGKDFQALDATLTALAGLATGANKLPYFTGTDTAAQTDLTSVGRDIIGKSTIADILTYLGIPASYATKSYVNDNFAPLVSPPLSGIPTAPTAALGTYNLQLATTAFVQNALNALVGAAPDTLDTLKELADALGDDANFAATVTTALAGKLNTSDLSFRSSADFFSVDFLGEMRIFSGNIAANFVAGKFSFTLPLAFPNANYSLIPYDPTGSINTYGKAVSGTVVEITGRDHNGTPSTGAIVLRYIATGLTQ
jgi:hypothetical protein